MNATGSAELLFEPEAMVDECAPIEHEVVVKPSHPVAASKPKGLAYRTEVAKIPGTRCEFASV